MSQTHHRALPVGMRIEADAIANGLAAGDFSDVHEGCCPSLHCDVAIKGCLPRALALPLTRRRF